MRRFPIAVVIGIIFITKKVLLKLSSEIKSRKFERSMKMIAVAPHHRFVQPMLASCISFGVGCYCFIHTTGNARAGFQDKADIVPTPSFLFIAFIWELESKTKNKLKMKTFRMIGMALFAVFMCVNFSACEEEEPGGIPQSFKAGSKIYFDSQSSTDGYASWGFDWFVAKSATKCQWAGSNYDGGNISENFSSAQYEYVVIGENKATLTSVNYQSTTGRVWHVSITMNYETNSSGTYVSEEFIPGGKTHYLSGVFEIQ